jgi:hypothetical protein
MGAIGLEAAAGSRDDPREAAAVDTAGWASWKPVNGAAIAAHLAGGAVLTVANRRRIRHQQGVFALSAAKAALTFGALAATAYGEVLDRRVRESAAASGPAEGYSAGSSGFGNPLERARNQRRKARLAVAALTGGVAVTSALLGERQRSGRALRDVVRALPEHLPTLALPAVADLPEQLKQLPDQLRQLPAHLPEPIRQLPGQIADALPDLHLPDVRMPDVRLPEVHLPEVKRPDVHLPEVRLPDLPSLPRARRLRRLAHR